MLPELKYNNIYLFVSDVPPAANEKWENNPRLHA